MTIIYILNQRAILTKVQYTSLRTIFLLKLCIANTVFIMIIVVSLSLNNCLAILFSTTYF